MDNLRAIVRNLFCYIFPEDVLNGKVIFDNIDKDTFIKLGNGYIDRYTNDELENMFRHWQEEFAWQNNRLKSEIPRWNADENISDRMNIFDALSTFNFNVLIEENGYPVCQYQHLLRWREMVTVLDEDLFTTSYLAMHDIIYGRERKNFFWKPVIGHNNFALNKLVARGIAENHFHMKGSAPTFNLSWISLMNNIANPKFAKILEGYDSNRLQMNISYYQIENHDGFVNMWRKAALIRLFLFSKLTNQPLIFDLDCSKINDGYEFNMEKFVVKMLHDSVLLDENLLDIQRNIQNIKCNLQNSEYDYTVCKAWLDQNEQNHLNEIISGERWFLYSVFTSIYTHRENWDKYGNIFYLYLVIKANIRREIVQTNKNVGFSNFSRYQDRKENFIDDTIYEDVYTRMAVKDTMLNQHIMSLEARVSPRKFDDEYEKYITKWDNCICKDCDKDTENKLLKRYFYVVHFIKERESYTDGKYRHFYKRNEVKKQAIALAKFKKKGTSASDRIKGIDAASAEIGCRPEVFGQAFRYLKNSNGTRYVYSEGETKPSDDLMATYHVGEDFLDVIDGMRAIDEAVRFLNLRCGDRLGHALALGINIDNWYTNKSNRILLPKQDYLDNIVWLYARIRSYHIEGCDDAKAYIEKRFAEYFKEIYMNNLNEDMLKHIEKNVNDFFSHTRHKFCYDNLNFGINEYYDAWKLRGDAPELYQDGFFKADSYKYDEWDYYSINNAYPLNYKIRYSPEITVIYYMYHYNAQVNKIGSQVVEVKMNSSLIDAAKKIQNAMQRDIARMGIAIETNPSSNYHIGTFRRYDRHPIVQWYNLGLVHDEMLLKKCPQIQVSINTDDQGVFYTYLENEYAYLALALEKMRDKDGEALYNRTFILQWLENIRQMGIAQSFIDTNNIWT